jgi:pyridoxamine 5'-phosphate oxidase family protein
MAPLEYTLTTTLPAGSSTNPRRPAVDDQAEAPNPIGQTGPGIELRGQAEIVMLDPPLLAGFSSETLRIRPHRIIAWNIGEFALSPGRPPHLQGYGSRNVACPI